MDTRADGEVSGECVLDEGSGQSRLEFPPLAQALPRTEHGLFPYVWHWSETVDGWSNQPGMTPHTIAANSGRNLSLGEVVGVSVSRGPFTVAYRHYFLPTQGGTVPPIWRGADMVEVRYKF